MEATYPKNLLFEYYDRVSQVQDSDVLGNWEVWIYGSDREAFPPHCHVRLKDGSFEFEVSLLNWKVINIKHSDIPNSWDSIGREVKKGFFEWLNRESKQVVTLTNKQFLYIFWDGANASNPLSNWVDKKEDIDGDLLSFLDKSIDVDKLRKQVIGSLFEIYSVDENTRNELHKLTPQDLLKAIGITIDIGSNQDAIEAVKTAEKNVYIWTAPRS